MAKRKKRQQQVSEPPVFGNGMPVLSVKDRNTSHIQIYLRDAGAYMVGAADSDPNSVIVGEVYRIGGRPVDESEELDPDGYYIIVDKDQLVDPPPRPDREPRPEYSLQIDRYALHFWLRDHFGALFDWSVANDMSAAGVVRFKNLSRSLFVKKMTRRAEAHIAKRLPKLFHLAITQLSVELEAFKPAMFFEGMGDIDKEYLPKKSDLKNTQALFYDVFSGGMKTRARGGDRRSGGGPTQAERRAIADRKAALKPFWDYLILQFQKNDYESDVWDWLKNRDQFKAQCATHGVTLMRILDSLIPDVLKRRPYWEKTVPDPMPEHLMPSSFALIHAAREMDIGGDYWALKKAVGKIKK